MGQAQSIFIGKSDSGAACGPETFITVNSDDSPVALDYETQYDISNDGAVDDSEPIDLDLPAILLADKGRCIWLYTCYLNDPNDQENFGHGELKPAAGDFIKVNGQLDAGPLDLTVNDDAIRLYHDGVDTWYLGN